MTTAKYSRHDARTVARLEVEVLRSYRYKVSCLKPAERRRELKAVRARLAVLQARTPYDSRPGRSAQ